MPELVLSSPSLASAAASSRQGAPLPFALNNIVPLQAPAQRSSGSKLVCNSSVPSNSTVGVSSASSTDRSSQHSNDACTNIDQHVLETDTNNTAPRPQQQSSQQAQQEAAQQQQFPGRQIWTRTAQLARIVSFPVRATRAYYSYVPLGQQLYLNPQTVATSLEPLAQPAAPSPDSQVSASPAAATSMVPGSAPFPATIPTQTVPDSSTAPLEKAAAAVDIVDSVVQLRREQLGRLWMHRMPTYRARFQQIFHAALSLPLPTLTTAAQDLPSGESGGGSAVALSRPIAPEVHVVKAEASASQLNPHHLKDMLKVSCQLLPVWEVLYAARF